ncbi:putative vomeronasal receptor-like protein 4 [Cynocephalus volans]|uniref:putative vomeronasal receptor-like protein 4 n=1 Tax=Cynocephalus volans TaxID=110931 RepID=UPI002FCC5329
MSQAGTGISANTFLLLVRISTLLLGHRPKLIDLITCHLALVHIVMLLIVVFLVSPDLFESLNFQNDFKCKVFFFMSRVMRGLSICTTCLLSMFQAITISPSTSWLARFKHKFTNDIIHILFFLWFLSLSCSSNLIFYTVASSNVTQTNLLSVSKYCSLFPMVSIIQEVFLTLTLFRDVSVVGIMMLSSAYMVILLFGHQRRSLHLHSTSLSPKSTPVKRASQTILLLVSFFVVMYWVDFIISSSSVLLWAYDAVVVDIQRFVGNVFATVSPLVIIRSDKRIIETLQNMWQKCHRF